MDIFDRKLRKMLIGIFLVFVLGLGAYFVSKANERTGLNSKLATKSSEFENWKTYKNTSLGFKMNYPQNMQIIKELNDQFNRKAKFLGGGYKFCVYLNPILPNTTLDQVSYMQARISEKGSLDGIPANIYKIPNYGVIYVAWRGSDQWTVSFFGDDSMSEEENKTLASFKFIN